ncbi:filensin [Nerophis lumbriciformis]|uniref:filensin n=1 Tax=Nerophis lumbriciformis TaxID=546530 RepID=UPI002ADF15B4|nr:filensin-like [Nerophis lumbriciformis]
MFKTSYLRREVRKEKYERSDVVQEEPEEDSAGISAIQGWENLQELNSRFARYINRARVLEQRNAVFRKQLETLQRMEEASGLEETFREQIDVNRQRIRELTSDHGKLERELRDACRMLDEFTNKYRNECDYQEQLRGTLEQLNKEADSDLLKNLEHQIQSQFLQDDVTSTRDRHRKNLAEIQTYVNILQQINQTLPLVPPVSVGISEEEEKLLAQSRLPGLLSQLEEYKSALCQLQAQKQRLQAEAAMMEQAIRGTQESFDNEIQLYNEQIESLRKEIEEAERSLERFTSECRHLAMYQTSLENELERYKRIIENEDNRLNSAIIGSPITLFTTSYHYSHTPSASNRGRDITLAIQDITNIKPRQKIMAKKVQKKKELTPRDVIDNGQEDRGAAGETPEEDAKGTPSVEGQEESVSRTEERPVFAGVSPQDVPDGAQISKAFDTLCNIVRDRMRKYRKPEPIADFYTKGRYVLVSGEGSYLDPCFYTSTPSSGHIVVTIKDQPLGRSAMSPEPPQPKPLGPTPPFNAWGSKEDARGGKGKDNGGKGKVKKNEEPDPQPKDPGPVQPSPDPKDPTGDPTKPKKNKDDDGPSRASPKSTPRAPSTSSSSSSSTSTSTSTSSSSGSGSGSGSGSSSSSSSSSFTPDAMSYEKVVVESVEKFSDGRKLKGYEETSMVVETTIEKSSKRKH